MNYISIIGTLKDYSVNETAALASLLYDENLGRKQSAINQEVNTKLRTLENSIERCAGFFRNSRDLPNEARRGDWAIVPDENNILWIWDYDGGSWNKTNQLYEGGDINLNGYATTDQLNAISNRVGDCALKTSVYTKTEVDNMLGNIDVSGIAAGPTHYFLTSAEYNALDEYEENAIYFILGNSERGLGTFPIKLK